MSPSGRKRARRRLRAPDPRWDPPPEVDGASVDRLTRALRLPAAVCAVLSARGLHDVEEAKRFLRPRLDHLDTPALLTDGPEAAARIARAVRSGEAIFVHGDYDVDGICGTALLTRFLRERGARVSGFVPHRLRDGYDFTAAGLDAARAQGADLVVTVDCGAVAHETVAAARTSGIDVVVTDHHTVSGALPEANAVVNPRRPDCRYADKDLCGAGLAFRLCQLVAEELGAGAEDLVTLVDLVAVATVADLVPLRGQNRVLTHYGLRRLARTGVVGLRALMEVSDVDPDAVTAGQVAFRLAPRINAAGRVGEAADALRLLLTDDEEESRRLASRLDELNARRREEDRRTLDEAMESLEERFDPASDFGVVLAGRGWHPGVIGIVASRVVERVHRPVVMISVDGERARGSARSIPGFHLYRALARCSEHFHRFGGHRQAAGMDVRVDAIDTFRAAFNEVAREELEGEDLRPTLRPDTDLELVEADLELAHWLSYLGPHGIGNPGPLFRARGLRVEGARVVGDGHLKVVLRQDRARVEAIGFGLAERLPPDAIADEPFDALLRVERNEYRGRASVQAKLTDLRPSRLAENTSGPAVRTRVS